MKQLIIILTLIISLSGLSQTMDNVQVTLQKTYTTVTKYGIDDPFYIVTDNQKKGVYNKDGKMIVSPGYYANISRLQASDESKPTFKSPEFYTLSELRPSGWHVAIFDISGHLIIGDGRYTRANIHPTFIEVENTFGLKGACDWQGREIIVPTFLGIKYNYDSKMFDCTLNNKDFFSTGIDLNGSTKSRQDSLLTIEQISNYYNIPDNRALPTYIKGQNYLNGQNYTHDFQLAYAFFDEAAKTDIRKAVAIADMKRYGIGVEQDETFALWCYEQAALAGQTAAWPGYFATKYDIEQKEKDELDTISYNKYRMSIIKAMVDRDYWGAIEILERIAENGYLPAQYDLGTYYMYRLYPLTDSVSLQKAEYWLKLSADAGYVLSQNNYAYLLEAYKQNYKESFNYYLMAANNAFPPSQYAVGIYYQNGIGGIKQNLTKAKKYIELSQKGGYEKARNSLDVLNDIIHDRKQARIEKFINAVDIFTQVALVVSETITTTSSHTFVNNTATMNSYNNTAIQHTNTNVAAPPKDKKHTYNYNTVLEQHAYDDYGKLLQNIYFGRYRANLTEIRNYQQRMKNIRLKWEEIGVNFYKSEWETWDGIPKK